MSYDIKDLTKNEAMDPDVDFAASSKHCSQIATRLQSNGTGLQQTTCSNSSPPASTATNAPNGPVMDGIETVEEEEEKEDGGDDRRKKKKRMRQDWKRKRRTQPRAAA